MFPTGIPLDDKKSIKDLEVKAMRYHEKCQQNNRMGLQ